MSPLRARRLQCGLTQAELAQRASVSRQLVAAVEAGQNIPAVDAALRIANALATSVEALFAPAVERVAPAVGSRLRGGAPVRVGRVGDRLVAAGMPDHGTAGDGWGTADGVVEGGAVRLFEGASVDRFVLAGCDPALGIAEAMLTGLGRSSLLAVSAPTDTAVRALAQRRVHAATVHAPAAQLPEPPGPVTRLHLAAWRVGLALGAGIAADTLEALVDQDVTIIQRDTAAASQQALARAGVQAGREIPTGPRAWGHIDAARQATIRRCAAVTTEAAAHAFELAFIPLEYHTVEIWIGEEWVHHAAVQALGNLLASSGFTERLATLGGYDLANTGTLVTPT